MCNRGHTTQCTSPLSHRFPTDDSVSNTNQILASQTRQRRFLTEFDFQIAAATIAASTAFLSSFAATKLSSYFLRLSSFIFATTSGSE